MKRNGTKKRAERKVMKMNKKQLLIGVLVLGLFLITVVPQGVYAEQTQYNAYKQVGANNTENGSKYLQGVANRIMIILGIVAGVLIAGLWIFIAIEFFSADPQKKAQAKEHMLWAGIGTIIIVMAVGGIIWMLAKWIAAA